MPEFYIVPPRLIVGSFDRANVVTSINNIKGDLTFTADPNTGITLKISGNNFEYGAIPGFYVKRSGDTFLGNLDFTPTGSNYGLAIAQLASNPGTGRTGGLYFNTTEGEIRYYYGATGWTSISTAGGISVGFADGRYLKLDASNDPMQGDLDMSTYFFRVGNKATQSIAGQAGQIYWNTDSYRLEVYNDNTLAWEPIGIGAGGGSATTAKNIETTLTDEDSSHYLIFSKNYGTSGVALSSTSGLRLNPSSDSIIQGQWRASAIATTYGGTGLTTYNQGDILVGTGASILTSLSKGPNKYVLSSNTIFPNGIGWTTVTGVAITSLTPSYAINADLWWNNEDGSLSIYYQDENTSQWVEIVNAFVSAGTADTVVELGQQYQVGIYNATGNKIVGSDTFTNNTSTSIVNINHSTASNSTLTGALVIKGGLGLSGSASIGQTLYFFNTNDSNYIGFKSNSATASTVYILPSSTPVGTANSVLQSTPSGTLSWVPMTATGGGGAGVVDNGNIYEIPYYYSSGTSITGSQYFHNVGTGITVLFGTSSSSTQTGALVIRGGLGVTGNAFIGGTVTGELFVGNYIGTAATATNFYGTLIGTATTATNVNVASSGNTNTNHFLLFSRFSSGTGLAVSSAIGLSYNPSTGVLIGNTFQGNFEGFLVGLANTATYAHQSGYAITAGSATTSNSFSVNSTNANVSHSLLFTPATSNSTGAGLSIDSTLVYNASTDRLFTSGLSVTSVTGSTSATTGALIVSGGLGVSGQLTAIKASLGFTNNTTTPILSFVGTGVTSPINISANSDSSLSFDGYAGQLFGLDNNLTEGEIFSVNDVSGLAIISASAGHTILLNQFEGYTKIGLGKYNATGTTSGSLVVIGGAGITGNAFIGGTVTAPLFVGNYIGTAATATNFYGTLNGTATTSTNVHVASAGNTNTNHFLLFSRFSSGTGLAVSSAIGLSYNPSTGVLIGNTFQGNFEGFLVGLANTASYAHQSGYAITSGTATTAANIHLRQATENSDFYVTLSKNISGSGVALSSGNSITYNPSSGLLSLGNGSLAANGVTVGSASRTISTATSDLILSSASGNVLIDNNLSVSGNLTINGTTTTIGSTITTLLDPIFVLGAGNGGTNPTIDDNKDRGIEFRYFSGTAKTGFFGFDDSTGYFTFIPDGINNDEVFSGNAGTALFSTVRADLVGTASTATYAHQAGYALTSGSGTVKTGTQYELGWYYQTGTAITGSGSGLTWNGNLLSIRNIDLSSNALIVNMDGGFVPMGDTATGDTAGLLLKAISLPNLGETYVAPSLQFDSNYEGSSSLISRFRIAPVSSGVMRFQSSIDNGTPAWDTIIQLNSPSDTSVSYGNNALFYSNIFAYVRADSDYATAIAATDTNQGVTIWSEFPATASTQMRWSPRFTMGGALWQNDIEADKKPEAYFQVGIANTSSSYVDYPGVYLFAHVVNRRIWEAYSTGEFKLKQPISSTGVTTGALVVPGGVGISGNAFIGGTINLINNTASIGKSSGALRVSGGVGIGGSIYTGGNINIESGNFIRLYEPGNTNYAAFKYTGATQKTYILPVDTPATGTSVLSSDTSGNMSWVAMSASGGAGNVDQGKVYAVPYYPSAGTLVTGSLNFFDVGTGVSITYSAASISTNTGALVVTGGVGVGGSLYVGGTASSISGLKINSSVITSGSWAGSTITMSYGGTGHTSNTKGDILVGTGQSWYKLSYSGNANDVLTVDSTQETGLKWASIPPASATSVSVKPANEAGARYITFVDQSTGSGLYLSTDTSLSYDASTNILTIGSLAANGVTVGLAQNTISTATGDLTLSSATGNVNIPGNLVVTGSTVSIGSSITTVLDPIFVLGAGVGGTNPTVDDNKDRGIEFRYFSGTAKTGFFGFDDSTGYFTFIPDGLNNNEVFSGTAGTAEFTTVIANLTGTATTAQNINVNSASNANSDHFLFFGRFATGTGLAVSSATGLSYNPSSGIIFGNAFIGSSVTATNFYGNLSGSAATATNFYGTLNGTATTATNTNLVSDSVATANHPITFTPSTTTISGGAQSFNTNVYVIPSGNIVVATGFTGGLTGNVTGTLTGTATTAQNVNVASSGTASNTHYITFVSAATGSGLALSTCLTFNINPSTDTISVSGLAVTSRTNSTSSTSGALTVGGGLGVSGNASIGQSLLFFTPSGVNYIAFRAPAATGNTTYTLPLSAPASTGSSVLTSDTSGNLNWIAMTASGGGTVYTGVAPRMAYYQTSGAAVTDTYGINYLNTGTASTFTIFGGASLGSTVFVVSAIGSTIVRVGIGISTPSYELEVVGEISATNKSFVIDHPTKPGMKLRYGSLEGPENGVYVRGVLNNSNVIETPDYWRGLVDSSTFTVNLTPIGNYQFLYVEKVDDYKVYVGCAGTFINCYYSVWAERKDVPKLKVEY